MVSIFSFLRADRSVLRQVMAIERYRTAVMRNPPCSPRSCFRLFVAPSGGGCLRVGYYIDPLRIRRGLGVVVVVPVPPLVRRGFGITLGRVLPSLLAAKRRDVQLAPGGPHRLVAPADDKVCAEDLPAVTEKHIVAVPFIDAEVFVEAVGDGVPGHVPLHACLQTRDVRLRGA